MMKLLLLFTLLVLSGPALANLCETKAFEVQSVGYVKADVAHRSRTTPGISNPLKANSKTNKDASSSQIRDPSVIGIETYSLALLRETKLWLQREITPQSAEAIEKANSLKTNDEGTQSSAINTKDIELLTHSHQKIPQSSATNLKAKAEILKTAGFSKLEIQKLMESDIVWTQNLSGEETLLKNLREGKEDIYFNSGFFILNQPYRIHKVVRKTHESFEVLAETVENGFLKSQTITIPKKPDDINSFWAIHPEHQVLFSVAQSQKPKITREDIKLPPPTHEEARLKEQGFGPAWTKGLDELNDWVAVRKQLQELKANPRTTHIPYFADQISTHLSFASEKLGSNVSKSQKKVLAYLRKEAKKAILKQKVTYGWWLKFNFQISSLLSGEKESHRLLESKSFFLINHITRILDLFPLQMAVPTIKGDLGIITFNVAQSEGIYPLGLISHPKKVDGILRNPLEFIRHDMIHAERNIGMVIQQYSTHHKLKHKKILELIESLPTEKRKRAELVYFALTHESEVAILFKKRPRKQKLNEIAQAFVTLLNDSVVPLKMAGLGKEYSDLKSEEDRIQYIREHVVKDFMREVYDPVFL